MFFLASLTKLRSLEGSWRPPWVCLPWCFKGQLDQEVFDLMKALVPWCIQNMLASLEGQESHRWDLFGGQWGHIHRDHDFFCLLSVFPLFFKLLPGASPPPPPPRLIEAMRFLTSCLIPAVKVTNISGIDLLSLGELVDVILHNQIQCFVGTHDIWILEWVLQSLPDIWGAHGLRVSILAEILSLMPLVVLSGPYLLHPLDGCWFMLWSC
jgi:hypothetical protein